MTIRKLLIAIGLLATLLPIPVGAADPPSALLLSPAITEEVLEPGTTKELTITVSNVAAIALPISASAGSLVLQDELLNNDERARFDVSAWISIPERRFILEPGKSREVKVQIAVPKNAEPGGHYAMIFFEPAIAVLPSNQSAVYQNMRVASTLLLQVPGDIRYGARLVNPPTTQPWRETGPVNFNVALQNTGNVHFAPVGALVIRDFQDKIVDRIPLPPGIVLPGTAKQYHLTWNKRFPLGLFTATVELSYGPKGMVLARTPTTFVVIPGISLIIICTVLSIVVPFIFRSRHRIVAALRALLKP